MPLSRAWWKSVSSEAEHGKGNMRLNHRVDEKVGILLTFMSVELSQKWNLPVLSATSAQRVTRMPICSPLLFKPSRGKCDLIVITCPWLHIGRHQSLWALPQSFYQFFLLIVDLPGPRSSFSSLSLQCSLWTISSISAAPNGTHIEILTTPRSTSAFQKVSSAKCNRLLNIFTWENNSNTSSQKNIQLKS